MIFIAPFSHTYQLVIRNDVCELLPLNEENLPLGNYKGSCGGCRLLDGGYLECDECVNQEDRTYSKIYARGGCTWITNMEGILYCTKNQTTFIYLPSNNENLPNGSYIDTCGGCKLSTKVEHHVSLECTHCLNGKYSIANPSKIFISNNDLINNYNGTLTCEWTTKDTILLSIIVPLSLIFAVMFACAHTL